MIERTLPSRHRIQNSCSGGLRSSTLPLGHRGSRQYWFFKSERGNFVSSKVEGQSGVWTRYLRLSAQAALPTASGPPPWQLHNVWLEHVRKYKRHALCWKCFHSASGGIMSLAIQTVILATTKVSEQMWSVPLINWSSSGKKIISARPVRKWYRSIK